jgi:hypothetical protein
MDGRGNRCPLCIDPLVPVSPPVEEISKRPGYLPCVRVKSAFRRGRHCCQQYPVLGFEPR